MNISAGENGMVIPCGQCGTRNRVAYANLAKETRCGNCKVPLPRPDGPIEIGSAAVFDRVMNESALPVLVDFWAEWCGPCKMMAPELERAARDLAGSVLVLKANTEELQETAARFQISSIPTLAVLFRGREITRASGARPAAAIVSFAQDAARSAQARAA